MGIGQFLGVFSFLFLAHIVGYIFYEPINLSILLIFFGGIGLGALSSLFWIPKSLRYALYHPFFLRNDKKLTKDFSGPFVSPSFSEPLFSLPIEKEEKPHVVFLFLESFGAKYVGTQATAYLNRWIQEGIYFSHFYSNGTLTYRALLSGLFGMLPQATTVGLLPYVNIPFRGIPQFLKNRGYKTAFHHSGSLHFDHQDRFLEKHFDELIDQYSMGMKHIRSVGWGIPDEHLMHYSADWLQKQREPSFLTMFTISNHHPWVLPPHYHSSLPNRFLQTLEYTDYALGQFCQGLSEKTILFILGDHGQPRGEHEGNFYNGRFLYEENVHIPLLILAKGRIVSPQVIDKIGSHIDLFPTLVDLFGGQEKCLGRSLRRSEPEGVAFSRNPYSEGFTSCRKGRWKWVEVESSSLQELYDLAEDPQEQYNLASLYPETAQELKRETHSFFSKIEGLYSVDRAIKFSPYCLDFSNSLIADWKLEKAASFKLHRVSLENCLLLTDLGIKRFLSQSPSLEELNLKGVTDITDGAFEILHPRLKKLDLSDAVYITGKNFSSFSPSLQELSLNGKNGVELDMEGLVQLKLLDASQINEDVLIRIIQKNRSLASLVIHQCDQLTDRILPFLEDLSLEILWLFGRHRMSGAGVESLNKMKIRSFKFGGYS